MNYPEDKKTKAMERLPDQEALQAVHEELLEKISANGNLPALGSLISRVVQMTSTDDEGLRDLAHFIMSDVALSQKILRLANAACFRGALPGAAVTTISRAIFLLGFDTVKTCALGLLLVDRMAGNRAAGVRAELLHALAASMFGRELARRGQFADDEEVAIASLFRNIGQLLVAAHDHALYADIQGRIRQGMAPETAARRVIGSSYEALAETVMTAWDMPDAIVYALKPLPAGVLRAAGNRREWVRQAAAFSDAAAAVLVDGQDAAASAALLARFARALEFDQDTFGHMVDTVREQTDALAGHLRLAPSPRPMPPSDTAGLWRSIEEGGEGGAAIPGLPDEFLLQPAPEANAQAAARHASGKPLNAGELLLGGIQDATEIMASGNYKVNDLIMLVLETIYRGMGFRFATICLKDVKSGQYRARISLGEGAAARQAGIAFAADGGRDLFQLALANDADLMIADSGAANIRDLIPAWHRAALADARSFIVLPLVLQNKPLGLFYADRTLPAPEGVPPGEAAMIRTLKGQVVAALNAR